LSEITLKESLKDLPIESQGLKKESLFFCPDCFGYKFYEGEVLNYGGNDLSGGIYPNKNWQRNRTIFWFSKQTENLLLLEVNIYKEEDKGRFLNDLLSVLGLPSYRKYKDKHEKEKDNPKNYIWETKNHNKTYFLEIKENRVTKKDTSYNLYVVLNSNKELFEKILEFPSYSYYGDFIRERERKKDLTYTYQQYVEDKVKSGRGENNTYYTK
jgi:hypothetical protein